MLVKKKDFPYKIDTEINICTNVGNRFFTRKN